MTGVQTCALPIFCHKSKDHIITYLLHACRLVFPGMVMFLCVWHVLKCWLTNLRNKLVDKLKFTEYFDALHVLMYMEGYARAPHVHEL